MFDTLLIATPLGASRYVVCEGWLEGWPNPVVHGRFASCLNHQQRWLLGSMWPWLLVLPVFPSPTSFLWECPGWFLPFLTSQTFRKPTMLIQFTWCWDNGDFDAFIKVWCYFLSPSWLLGWLFFFSAECRHLLYNSPHVCHFIFLHRSTSCWHQPRNSDIWLRLVQLRTHKTLGFFKGGIWESRRKNTSVRSAGRQMVPEESKGSKLSTVL